MERYNVTIHPPLGPPLRLLVPFAPSALISELQAEVKKRAVRRGIWSQNEDVLLRLEEIDALMDGEDVLGDIVQDARTERIVATTSNSGPPATRATQHNAIIPHLQAAEGDFKLRIITPRSARRHKDLKDIAALPDGITATTSLRDIRAHAARHVNYDDPSKILDLHIAGVPVTSMRIDATVGESGLADAVVNGVLNVHVVLRKLSVMPQHPSLGKDAIFRDRDHWEQSIPQSERGMAMFLSSLRVFSDLVNAKEMDQSTQDAVLHALQLLTNFPPAVRTMYILMSGKTPKPEDCAALSQALFEFLNDQVPAQLIGSHKGRVFEGARLLFGLLLGKAKHIKLPADASSPYFGAMKIFDTMATVTMATVLMGQESSTKRIKWLCGVQREILVFDSDALSSVEGYDGTRDIDRIFSTHEMKDPHYLVLLCERNRLSVIPPSRLAQSGEPALSLDREGLLAVYTGRAACAEAGKDINLYRPTKGGEETVDVAIIEQVIEPILRRREADGTSVFDGFGGGSCRKAATPDELLVICVDTSRSMGEQTDFCEVNDNFQEQPSPSFKTQIEGDTTFPRATLDDMKATILEHEAFEDIVCILHDAAVNEKKATAYKLLEILGTLASKELSNQLKKEERRRSLFTRTHIQNTFSARSRRIAELKSFIAGLDTHKQTICDFLTFRAENCAVLDQDWMWSLGETIPKLPSSGASNGNSSPEVSAPHEFLDPITQELMGDPVVASDGFTYERNSIERWFQIRNSSPNTGLELSDLTLNTNVDLSNRIRAWIRAEDILDSAEHTASALDVTILTRLGTYRRRIRPDLKMSDVYTVASRALKGRYANLELHCKNVTLLSSQRPISSTNITQDSIIHVRIHDGLVNGGSPMEGRTNVSTVAQKLVLIKVYDRPESVLFSYWVPRDTKKTMASILFKYWRYNIKHHRIIDVDDLIAWTNFAYFGDNVVIGHPQHHWKQLHSFFDSDHATGILADEPLYTKPRRPTRVVHDMNDAEPEDSNGDDGNDWERYHHMVLTPRPLVLKLCMSEWRGWPTPIYLSRLDVLKQMFEAFINRTLAYNYRTHVGLVTFSTTPKLAQPITHVIEDFRHTVNEMSAEGDTALWDAISLAKDQLSEYSEKFPGATKRILCISDGIDNMSGKRSYDLCRMLRTENVVVDSFCLGDEDNYELRTVSHLSGGYKFTPKSLEQAMAICEMEPVLSQGERPPVQRPAVIGTLHRPQFLHAVPKAIPEMVTRDTFPARKKHPNVNDQFVRLQGFVRSSVASRSNANLRTSRLLQEIRDIVANPHPYYDAYISESNMAFWKIAMQGPPDSPYANGTFVMYLDMEESYPAFPPKGRFITPIYHPNINRHGRICHSIFDRNWTSDTTIKAVLDTVFSLLLVPEFTDPVNATITLDFHHDEVQFRDEVKQHIEKHATKSRTAWCGELTGESSSADF